MEKFNHPEWFGPTGESSYCLAGVVHTMLTHTTRDGVLTFFAGLADWDAAFHDLLAEGGLLHVAAAGFVRTPRTPPSVQLEASNAPRHGTACALVH